MKILLIGHSCSPFLGSEPGGCWNWAKHLAAYNQVWLIRHPQYRADFDRLDPADFPKNLQIQWTSLPRHLDPWDPEKGLHWLELHYMLWLQEALRRAQTLHREIGFDIVHHVALGTVGLPSPFWKVGPPFFWGPLGGGQQTPSAFYSYFGSRAMPGELMRKARVQMMPHVPAFRRSVRHASMIFATNDETLALLKRAGAGNTMLFLDSGVYPDWLAPEPPQMHDQKKSVTLLWCGSLTPRKAPQLALEALAAAQDPRIRLEIAGDGALLESMQVLSKNLGLQDRVTFLGLMKREPLRQRFRAADGFFFTSLRDSFGSTVLEAMAVGLPVITLAHQGVASFVPAEASIKVPVTDPRTTVSSLGEALRLFAGSAEARNRMARASWNFARANTWDRRALEMTSLYELHCARTRSYRIA